MNTYLFQIDPMAASSYGLYKSLKKEEGSFVDFLLSYDSHSVNEGDNSWLNKVLFENLSEKLTSPTLMEALNFSNVNTIDLFSSQNFFDSQVQMYKLQVKQEMAKKSFNKLS